MVGRRREADVARRQPPSRGKNDVARREVLALAADVPPGGHGLVDADCVAVSGCVLLQQDRVGAGGEYAAGEQAHRFAGADRLVEGMSGGGGADHAQAGVEASVSGAQGVAVHRGQVGGGLGEPSGDVCGGDAVPGIGEGDDLGRRGAQRVQDSFTGFLDTDHAVLRIVRPMWAHSRYVSSRACRWLCWLTF